jgi:hypothetical protein
LNRLRLRRFALPHQSGDRSLADQNAALRLGSANGQSIAGELEIANLFAAFVNLVPGAIAALFSKGPEY